MDNYLKQLKENDRTVIKKGELNYRASGKNNANVMDNFACVTTEDICSSEEVTYQYDWVYSVK